jgi:hypothetical protein
MKHGWENDGNPDDNGQFAAYIDMEDGSRPSRFIGQDYKSVADSMMVAYGNATAEMQRQRELARRAMKPDAAPSRMVEQRVAPISADEAFQLTDDIKDPAKFQGAISRAVEAQIGKPLSQIAAVTSATQETDAEKYYRTEAQAFTAATPEYYVDPTNLELLFNWLEKRKLDLTRNNLTLAYLDLSDRGLLIQRPDGEQATPAQPQTPGAQSSRPEPNQPTVRPRIGSVSTGLRSGDSSATPPPPAAPKKLTRAEIDAMPKDVYADKIRTDANFRRQVDSLV